MPRVGCRSVYGHPTYISYLRPHGRGMKCTMCAFVSISSENACVIKRFYCTSFSKLIFLDRTEGVMAVARDLWWNTHEKLEGDEVVAGRNKITRHLKKLLHVFGTQARASIRTLACILRVQHGPKPCNLWTQRIGERSFVYWTFRWLDLSGLYIWIESPHC